MSKITKYAQKLFGTSAIGTAIGKFGSLAAGSPAQAANPSDVQSLSQFTGGWTSAIVGSNSPAVEDMNALFYLAFYQLSYLMQQGVAEYDSSTTYFVGSLVNNGYGVIYCCYNDNGGTGISGQALSNSTYWKISFQENQIKNYAINGAFDFWQATGGGFFNSDQTNQNLASNYDSPSILTGGSAGVYQKFSADMVSFSALILSGQLVQMQASPNTSPANYSSGAYGDKSCRASYQFLWSPYSTSSAGIDMRANSGQTNAAYPFTYSIEGAFMRDLSGKNISISFWTFVTSAGTYNACILLPKFNSYYVTTFTVSAASTFQYITLNIDLPAQGLTPEQYNYDNTAGMTVILFPTGSAGFQASSLNTWNLNTSYSTYKTWSSGTFDWTNQSIWSCYVAQFSVTLGKIPMNKDSYTRKGSTYEEEFRLCQRYYEKTLVPWLNPARATSPGWEYYQTGLPTSAKDFNVYCPFMVTKAYVPNVTSYNGYTTISTAGKIRDQVSSVNVNGECYNVSTQGASIGATPNGTNGNVNLSGIWVFDSRI